MPPLAIGASHSLSVHPRPLFVPSGLDVAPGETYRFVARGKWMDWFKKTDAQGFRLLNLQHWNRVPDVNFFCLCGCVGTEEKHAFAIGTEFEWVVPDSVSGFPDKQLNFFANDWRRHYGNNRELPPENDGPLTVRMTRIA
ncbi:MAG: hypothetical protein K9J74_06455 [Sulfuritalea sp.]|nr:hypothetical protein [Sulfuritalea sp.]